VLTVTHVALAGRVAQLGFVAALIGEKVTGYGPLKQFGMETGIPLGAASFGLLAFIAFLFVAAVFEVRVKPPCFACLLLQAFCPVLLLAAPRCVHHSLSSYCCSMYGALL
jgi:hypothetical protein